MKANWNRPLVALAVLVAATSLHAQGTAFTYQGRLNQNGSPATGIYDLRFTIYDAGGGGAIVAGPLTQNGLGVTNGLFTTALDFGAGVFTGAGRWLEIAVRTNGGPVFSNLSPRQALLPAPYAIHAGSASNVANGSVVKSLNALRDNITLAAGANVTLATNSNTLTISSTGPGGGVWSLSGANAYYNAGNVGIGTSTPTEKLTIAGVSSYNNGLKLTGSTASGTGMTLENTAAGGHRYNLLSGGDFTGVGAGGFGIYDETIGDYRFAIGANGNVGIGTPTPAARLYVVSLTASALDNTATFYAPGIGPDASHVHYGTTGDWFIRSANSGGKVVLQDYGGNVGIGTQIPARKLTVFSSLYGIEHTDGNVRMGTYVGGTAGWFGTISNHKLYFFVNDGGASMAVDTTGNVGVGTTSPSFKLDVAGDAAVTRLILRADPGAPANAAVLCADPAVQNFVPYNTANARPLNLIVRDATVRVLTITGGADVAEPFQMSSDSIPKGAVVVIDEENPGQLKLSTESYDTRVAGVVSGANGIRPGISLHQEGALEGSEHVALSGRVYVQADATFGAIKPGDLLTTSDTPGHAMKVGDHAKAQGAILGKAMSALHEGKGMVLVLVTLQ